MEQADRAAGVHEVLESLNARRNEAIPPPLPMDSVEAALPEWEAPETPAPPVMVEPKEPFSLERFMGVKLFAWLGGVAMFFGVVFFVKYAFEKNLIPPAVRIAMGFATGTGMLVGGLWAHRLPRYRVLAQAFCATGVLILYGVTFAAHAIYHFEAFGSFPTFVVMGLVTVVAFLIAVRLAVLGKQGPLVLATLGGTLAVEAVWHGNHFLADSPMVALPWYLGFYALFLVFPFVFRKACAGQAAPWIASALSGVGHFLLVHHLVKHAFPNGMMGLLPAGFAVPALAALFVVIRSAKEMDERNRSQLAWFGGVLLFLLLNIEIADYFTSPGDRCVAFMFGGNFARDMTYSIAWGLFSLGLLGIGIWKASKHARYAAIGLLVVTLIKLFLHDLAAIENIFRVGALIGVAVIAFIASFLYHRFFDRTEPS